MIWVENVLWLSAATYAFFTLWLWKTWRVMRVIPDRNGALQRSDRNGEVIISVIIPVRNEALHLPALLEDLDRQVLLKSAFEVWVVDDRSSDGTPEIVAGFAKSHDLNLYLLESDGDLASAPKKRAISTAIERVNGRYIVTTDGDCRVGEGWLDSILSFFQTTGAKCISGPVTFTQERNVFDYLQTVEFSSLIGTGACAIAAGRPNMSNGANFAYEKQVFTEVRGFEGVEGIASGDDELLLQKIAEKYPEGIFFLKAEEAIVQTESQKTWGGFRNQRQRWASKWKYYRNAGPKLLAAFIFTANFSLVMAGVLFIAGILSGYTFLSVTALKVLPEWLFIGSVLRFLKKEHTMVYIPLVQLVYPFYVMFFGLVGQKKVYNWKGRDLS